jgi:hypothetical protein
MASLPIACIVEGHGEVEAVPVLVRRLAARVDPTLHIQVKRPLRITRSQLVRARELERAVELAARQVGKQGGILVLIDSDDDCPAELGPQLLDRARKARGDLPIGVVLAKREFEGWFLASAESLRGQRGLPDNLTSPSDPEAIRGAKEWIVRHMIGGGTYSETLDQPALTAIFDLDQAAARSDSFDKCLREVTGLILSLTTIHPGPATDASGVPLPDSSRPVS